MPCCGSSNEKPTGGGCCRDDDRDTSEQIKAIGDNEAANTVHVEEKHERTKKRGCGCQC
jgi:hypothetical protein